MNQKGSGMIPTMRYKNAPVAIEWLCKAFGFEKHLVVPAEDGTIAHAQLTLDNTMIMLGSAKDDAYGRFLTTPNEIDGYNTQAPYVVIENIDDHYLKAKLAGAEMILDIKDEDYGGRGYSCRDLEGYIWNFGSYNPWD